MRKESITSRRDTVRQGGDEGVKVGEESLKKERGGDKLLSLQSLTAISDN